MRGGNHQSLEKIFWGALYVDPIEHNNEDEANIVHTSVDVDSATDLITEDELTSALRAMSNGKAAGEDELFIEIVKLHGSKKKKTSTQHIMKKGFQTTGHGLQSVPPTKRKVRRQIAVTTEEWPYSAMSANTWKSFRQKSTRVYWRHSRKLAIRLQTMTKNQWSNFCYEDTIGEVQRVEHWQIHCFCWLGKLEKTFDRIDRSRLCEVIR